MRGGGLRIGWLARLTRGRLGMGRWTEPELVEIRRRAAARVAEIRPYLGGPDPESYGPPP